MSFTSRAGASHHVVNLLTKEAFGVQFVCNQKDWANLDVYVSYNRNVGSDCKAICSVANALNEIAVMLISWGSRLVMRDIVEQRAQKIDPTIGIIADEATPNKQHVRIFRTVGE